MPKEVSSKFYDLLRIHLETGQDYRYMAFTKDQKHRLMICKEVYEILKVNPYLDTNQFLKNKYQRTPSEIYNDMQVVNFIISICSAGTKEVSRLRVRKNAELAMKMAYNQGDVKNMLAAGDRLERIERLNEAEQGEDWENSIVKMPIVFTVDPRKLYPDKEFRNAKELDRIRAKYHVKKDPIMEMMERKKEQLLQSCDDEEADFIPIDPEEEDDEDIIGTE